MPNLDDSIIKKVEDPNLSDEEEEEEAEDISQMFNVDVEDIHNAQKIILQRQFFESIVRAAAIKFNNRPDLPTLADKVEAMFKTKLMPLCGKNKAKTPEDEVSLCLNNSVQESIQTI